MSTIKIKVPILLFLLTFIVAGYFSRIGVDPHHDGIMFKPAFDVARGAMLFRDTFTQYGAFTTLLQAGTLVIFGKYLLTLRVLTAFFYGLIAVLLYSIYRRILPNLLSFITVLLWIFMAPYFLLPFFPWASVYALFFQLLGTYFLILSEERANVWYLLWTGLATSAIFFTRQPGGVFMFAAVYAYLFCTFVTKNLSLQKFIRALYLYTCGVVLIVSGFLIWITANRAFRDFWLQSIEFAYNFGANRPTATAGGILISLFPGGRWPISIWTLFPIVTLFVCSICFIGLILNRHVHQTKIIVIIAIIGLSAWNQYYPVTDERHVYWGGTQMFGLLTLALFTVCGYLVHFVPKHRRLLTIGLTCLALTYVFLPDISLRMTRGLQKLKAPYVMVSQPEILRGMLTSAADAQFYSSVSAAMTAYFRAHPSGNILNLSGDALCGTFDPHIRNIHPLYIVWMELFPIYPDYFITHIPAYIHTHKPLIISNGLSWIPDDYCPIATPPNADTIELSLPCQNK